MLTNMTNMRKEIDEIPEATARLLDGSASELAAAGRALREKDPAFLITIARGSSDHAATFIKYAVELTPAALSPRSDRHSLRSTAPA